MSTASSLIMDSSAIESFEMVNDLSLLKSTDESRMSISVDTAFKEIFDNGNDFVRLELNMDVDAITPDNEKLTAMKVKQISIFQHENDDLSTEEIINNFALNMISISYPYVRSFISGVSALSGIPPIEIPTINVLNLMGDNSDSEN